MKYWHDKQIKDDAKVLKRLRAAHKAIETALSGRDYDLLTGSERSVLEDAKVQLDALIKHRVPQGTWL